jgi:hypothetical protein
MEPVIEAALITTAGTVAAACISAWREIARGAKTSTSDQLPDPAKPLKPAPRPTLVFILVLALGLAVTALLTSFLTHSNAVVNKASSVLPKGAVVMWWGEKDKWPKNFELCDGGRCQDLGYEKPNLQGCFARGAKVGANTVTNDDKGGSDTHPLPDHVHTLPELVAGFGPAIQRNTYQQVEGKPILNNRFTRGFEPKNLISIWNRDDRNSDDSPARNVEFRSTEVFAGSAPGAVIQTDSTSKATVETLPKYQEIFYIIKVRD